MDIDPYKQLKLEFKGIRSVIEEYTSDGNIVNFLDGLENALQVDEVEEVLYYLGEICDWYQVNIGSIHSNEYVFNGDSHDRNRQLLVELQSKLATYDFTEIARKAEIKDTTPKIFLSHRSTDKKYADALEKLLVGIGIKNEQLVYTSHPLHKIPLDAPIYDYLRDNFNCNLFVIILWSNEYLESPACLNEMGAAWVTQKDYTNIYTPDFQFGNPKYHECAVDTRKMGAVLNGDANCKASMIEFKNKITDLFGLSIDEQSWTYILDEFMNAII